MDCQHILQFNKKLYQQLVDYPTDVIPIFDLVALRVFKDHVLGQTGFEHGGVEASNMDGAPE